jgi:hypothetical protein
MTSLLGHLEFVRRYGAADLAQADPDLIPAAQLACAAGCHARWRELTEAEERPQ